MNPYVENLIRTKPQHEWTPEEAAAVAREQAQGLNLAIEPTNAEQLAYTLGVDPALSPGKGKQ